MCLAAREIMLRIVKLLRSEVSVEVDGTLNLTSRVSTILHSGIAAASLGEAKLHEFLTVRIIYGIINSTNLNLTELRKNGIR